MSNAWNPPSTWQQISEAMDTPLSDKAIQLLDERDRSLDGIGGAASIPTSGEFTTVTGNDFTGDEFKLLGTISAPSPKPSGASYLQLTCSMLLVDDTGTPPSALRIGACVTKSGVAPGFGTQVLALGFSGNITGGVVTPSGGEAFYATSIGISSISSGDTMQDLDVYMGAFSLYSFGGGAEMTISLTWVTGQALQSA